jgi:nucleoside-diphosphate-sugar epimerase
MRILVIGGTRFIGLAAVRALADAGHDITIFHRGQTEPDLPASVKHLHCGDASPAFIGWKVQFLPQFIDEFRRLAPDVVLDMAPFTEQDARAVMETFSGIAGRIVTISSQDVYRAFARVNRTEPGPPDPVPLTEDSPLRDKLYPYRQEKLRDANDPQKMFDDYDKILVERIMLRDPAMPGTVLRLTAVYGPLDYQHRLFEFLKRMDDQRPAILLEENLARWRWTRGYIEDVAQAIALAVTDERATGRIYNVGEPRALSMLEWIRAIGEAADWHGEIVPLPAERLPAHLIKDIDTHQDVLVDTSRIRRELGYSETIAPDEALRRTVAWERANPPQKIDPKQFDYAAEDAVLATLKQ